MPSSQISEVRCAMLAPGVEGLRRVAVLWWCLWRQSVRHARTSRARDAVVIRLADAANHGHAGLDQVMLRGWGRCR